jgi:hypothetical protein
MVSRAKVGKVLSLVELVRIAEFEEVLSLVEIVRRAEVEETCHWLKWLGEHRLWYQERIEQICKHFGNNILERFFFVNHVNDFEIRLFEKNNFESYQPFLHTVITGAKIARIFKNLQQKIDRKFQRFEWQRGSPRSDENIIVAEQ